jgi:phage baseplate assembly protein W
MGIVATVSSVNQQFTDLDLSFQQNPITGDVSQLLDSYAVTQAMINLILLNPYEVPFHPEISSQANALLFELDSPALQATIKTTIIQVITKFEPRVQLYEVYVVPNYIDNGYDVTVKFTIIGSGITYQVRTLLTRTL